MNATEEKKTEDKPFEEIVLWMARYCCDEDRKALRNPLWDRTITGDAVYASDGRTAFYAELETDDNAVNRVNAEGEDRKTVKAIQRLLKSACDNRASVADGADFYHIDPDKLLAAYTKNVKAVDEANQKLREERGRCCPCCGRPYEDDDEGIEKKHGAIHFWVGNHSVYLTPRQAMHMANFLRLFTKNTLFSYNAKSKRIFMWCDDRNAEMRQSVSSYSSPCIMPSKPFQGCNQFAES